MSLLLGAGAALAASHTFNGVYHGIHQTVRSGDDLYHGWTEHGHGYKKGSVWKLDFAGNSQRCSYSGTGVHMHCESAFTSSGATGWSRATNDGQYCLGTDSYGHSTTYRYSDGHGVCDHRTDP